MKRTTRSIGLLILASGLSACSSRGLLKERLAPQNVAANTVGYTSIGGANPASASFSLGGSR